jgi:hypothetical protein
MFVSYFLLLAEAAKFISAYGTNIHISACNRASKTSSPTPAPAPAANVSTPAPARPPTTASRSSKDPTPLTSTPAFHHRTPLGSRWTEPTTATTLDLHRPTLEVGQALNTVRTPTTTTTLTVTAPLTLTTWRLNMAVARAQGVGPARMATRARARATQTRLLHSMSTIPDMDTIEADQAWEEGEGL